MAKKKKAKCVRGKRPNGSCCWGKKKDGTCRRRKKTARHEKFGKRASRAKNKCLRMVASGEVKVTAKSAKAFDRCVGREMKG